MSASGKGVKVNFEMTTLEILPQQLQFDGDSATGSDPLSPLADPVETKQEYDMVKLQSDFLPNPNPLGQPVISPPIQVFFSSKEDGEKQLRDAVKKNNYETVDSLLKAGIDPDASGTRNTPLVYSIQNSRDDQIFWRLVQAGANIFVKYESMGVSCSIAEDIGIGCTWPTEMKRKALEYLSTKQISLPAILQAACLGDEAILKAEIARNQLSVTDNRKNTALHYAALNGHINLCKIIRIKKPILMKETNMDDQTAMLLSARMGCLRSIQWLVSNGASITEADTGQLKQTPLMLAAAGGHLATLEWLYANGAVNVTEADAYKYSRKTPLMLAVEGGHVSVLEWLYSKGAVNVTEADTGEYKRTPLMLAASEGHLPVLEWLYSKGAVNVTEADRGFFKRTPLMCAASGGHLSVLEWLYSKGAVNVTEADRGFCKQTPLMYAAQRGHLSVLEWLYSKPASAGLRDANGDFPISHSPSVTALDCPPVADSFGRPASAASDDAAPTNGSTAIQPGCFARQAPPSSGFSSSVTSSGAVNVTEADTSESSRKTPLMWAAAGGRNLATLEWLYAKGAVNVTEKDAHGKTPLMHAAAGHDLATVEWLYAKGAVNITEKDADGKTPLMHAAWGGDLATVEWLYAKGANITEAATRLGKQTPLMVAAGRGHVSLLEWLYSKGAVNVTEADYFGETPLMSAAKGGHLATLEWLYAKGAVNMTEADYLGKTPLMLAAKGGYLSVLEWLYSKGAVNVDAKDKDGKTAIDLAKTEYIKAFLRNPRIKKSLPQSAASASAAGHYSFFQPAPSVASLNARASHKECCLLM